MCTGGWGKGVYFLKNFKKIIKKSINIALKKDTKPSNHQTYGETFDRNYQDLET